MLAAVLLLGGCADGAGPPGAALPSSPAVEDVGAAADEARPAGPPAAPPTAPPTAPPATAGESHQSAAQFVRLWIAEANMALRTGETALLRRLSAERCGTCAGVIEDIEAVYAGGGRIAGGLLTIRQVSASRLRADAVPTVVIEASASGKTEFRADGSVLADAEPERVTLVFALERLASSWRIDTIKLGA